HAVLMKPKTAFACLLLLTAALGQKHDSPRPNGTIYGIAIGQEGQPATGIGLQAEPLGVALGAKLPRTTTNERGEYRFVNIPWWGRYRACAEDDEAGYSTYATGCGQNQPPEVELTPERPEAELRVDLPPKAGFLQVNLSDRKTGAAIPGMRVVVTSSGNRPSLIVSMSCYSTKVVLLPPDKDVLLHVTSDGFREWKESVGRGKPLRLASGTRLSLDVQLDPSD
ncbi:MAG TPA: hypothetical protein VG498_19055, partial [Terriglobales bacterium]|nr:hypothetical protein [Terriglobales bacterium]